jgi:GntR family transcriptional repressor for pyruvate dehydrogenase complex
MAAHRDPSLLDRSILEELEGRREPLGASNLGVSLGHLTLSEATIGRKLKQLDRRGLTKGFGKRGRMLTERGKRYLEELRQQARQTKQAAALLKVLTVETKEHLMDVLEARLLLESEIARAAARRATAAQLAEAARILDQQEEAVARGESGTAEGLRFHEIVARMSGKRVLALAVDLIRQQSSLSQYVGDIRALVAGRRLSEHRVILTAIGTRDPEQAWKAAAQHIKSVIRDVEKYWSVVRRGRGRQAHAAKRARRAR